jgi:chloramphenicol 3-O phosphotransferase
LNGGSSSGKSSIARSLQVVLPRRWLTLGVDDLIDAMPPPMNDSGSGIAVDPDGLVTIGLAFRQLEAAWYAGLSAMARAGVGVIVDEVFLGGGASQARLRAALDGLQVLWIGVHCEREVAIAREAERPDRFPGMAASQAELVHEGVRYDMQVDTTSTTAMDCAREIFRFAIDVDPRFHRVGDPED